jgi:SAM-dependent methyltransferase
MIDRNNPGFWDAWYAAKDTPWDLGGIPEKLKEYLISEPPGRVLIPGCGRGHEVQAFYQTGWEVEAIDFSPEAVRTARESLGEAGRCVREADFFREEFRLPFDLIYERTFLCAVSPTLRPDYARAVTAAIRPGGCLVGAFFYGEAEEKGPPSPLAPGELQELLKDHFALESNEMVADSLPAFQGRERWQVWRKVS